MKRPYLTDAEELLTSFPKRSTIRIARSKAIERYTYKAAEPMFLRLFFY